MAVGWFVEVIDGPLIYLKTSGDRFIIPIPWAGETRYYPKAPRMGKCKLSLGLDLFKVSASP